MQTSFLLQPTRPFRLDYTVWALQRRNENGVDIWKDGLYTRLFFIKDQLLKVSVSQKSEQEILVSTHKDVSPQIKSELICLLSKMLGLNRDLLPFYRLAEKDPDLHAMVMPFKGLKPPRYASIFEALVNAISCQQLSLDAGLKIQGRFIRSIGRKMGDAHGPLYAFPLPNDVAGCSIPDLKQLGYSTHKSKTLIELSSRMTEEAGLLDGLEEKNNQEVVKFLCQFYGIGRWSAEYVLLRGLGRTDVFPGDDVGAAKNLQVLLRLEDKLNYEKISQITQKWHPYSGFIYFNLLLQKLHNKGWLDPL